MQPIPHSIEFAINLIRTAFRSAVPRYESYNITTASTRMSIFIQYKQRRRLVSHDDRGS